MTFRALAGGGQACAYCGFCLVMEGPRQCCPAGRDYDALAARLAEAERLLREARSYWVTLNGPSNEANLAARIDAALGPTVSASVGQESK